MLTSSPGMYPAAQHDAMQPAVALATPLFPPQTNQGASPADHHQTTELRLRETASFSARPRPRPSPSMTSSSPSTRLPAATGRPWPPRSTLTRVACPPSSTTPPSSLAMPETTRASATPSSSPAAPSPSLPRSPRHRPRPRSTTRPRMAPSSRRTSRVSSTSAS